MPSLAPKAGFGPVLSIQVSLNEKDMTQISDKTSKWKIPSLVAIVTRNLLLKKVGRREKDEKSEENSIMVRLRRCDKER